MNYRTLFFEFLSNFREYHFDTFQLLLFDNNEENNILKLINNKEVVDIYQLKNTQVFHKTVSFTDLSSTVANLLFVSMEPTVLEISKVDNDLRKYNDLYNGKSIYELNNKYLLVFPIYKEEQLLGGFFIYSNYQVIWQIQKNKVLKFIKDLNEASCLELICDIDNKAKTTYWAYVNKGVYLSNNLSLLLNNNQYNTAFDFKGNSLMKIDEFSYLNGCVNVFEPIKKEDIKSIIEFKRLKFVYNTFVYTRAIDDDIFTHTNKIEEIIQKIDGKFGKYQMFQTSDNSITIVYDNEISKKDIQLAFDNVEFILIRNGIELKKHIDLSILIDYLNLSPVEEFNQNYFDYYYNKWLSEKKEQVLSNYSSSKILITPLIDSINMNIGGYLIKDQYNLNNASKENKLKSIKAISKVAEDYKQEIIFICLSLNDILNNGRIHIAYLNVLKEITMKYNCYFLIDYNKNVFLEINKLWDGFFKYIIINEENNNLLDILIIKNSVHGICLSSDVYLNLMKNDEKMGLEVTNMCINNFGLVIVKVSQRDILKYNNKKVLLLTIGA